MRKDVDDKSITVSEDKPDAHGPGRRGFSRLLRAGVVLLTLAAVGLPVVEAASAYGTTNTVQLDDGTCGNDLQLGSNITASSSATPTFLLYADGGAASYAVSIDGTSIGTFKGNNMGNACINDPLVLTNGAHVLTASELAPKPANPVTPFSFTVDTTPPSVPSTPILDPGTDSGVKGDGITNVTSPALDGTSDPSVSITVYDGTKLVGGAAASSTGHWEVTVIALADGVHSLTARAMDEAGNLSAMSAPYQLTIDTTAPAAPPAPVLEPASDTPPTGDNSTSITTPVVGGTAEAGSTVAVFVGGSKVGTTPADGSGNWQFTLPVMSVGTHAVTVTATDAAGNTSPVSASLTLTITTGTVAATAPSAPVLSATAGTSSVSLSWTTPANGGSAITGYNVYRGTSAGTETLLASVGLTASYTDAGLPPGTSDYYEVTAVNSVGESVRSNETEVTIAATVPSAPVLSATAGTSSVALSWTVPATGGSAITGYNVYRGTASGTETLLASVGPTTTTYADAGLAPGTTDYYEVTAVNSFGESIRSNEKAATMAATVPSAPVLSATAGTSSVALSWTVPATGGSALTGYNVYRGTASGTETLLASVGPTTTTYADAGLAPGTTDYYEVTAVNSFGESIRSNEKAATMAATVPSAPVLSATAGTSSVALSAGRCRPPAGRPSPATTSTGARLRAPRPCWPAWAPPPPPTPMPAWPRAPPATTK
jgi:fibronectin type 3 domain-containing protein